MSNSYSIIICDKDTGLPRTGLSVKLRYSKDSYATDAFTAVEVDDVNNPGEYRAENLVTARYKTWVDGSEDDSFGGDNGRPIIADEDLLLLDAGAAYWDHKNKRAGNIADPVNDQDAANKRWSLDQHYTKTQSNASLALKVALGGTETITGLKQFEILPKIVPTDGGDGSLPTPTNLGDVIYLKYFNQILANLNVLPVEQSAQVIRVYGGATAQTGKLYPSILAAVNNAFSHTPDEGHQYSILIENMGPGVEIMSAASGSLKDFIHLIAAGRFIKIIIEDDTLLSNSSIENATLNFGAGVITTPRLFNGLTLVNCKCYNWENITFKNGGLVNCTFISDTGKKIKFEDACNVEGCILNAEPELISHDGVLFYDVVTGVYSMPEDPTIPV